MADCALELAGLDSTLISSVHGPYRQWVGTPSSPGQNTSSVWCLDVESEMWAVGAVVSRRFRCAGQTAMVLGYRQLSSRQLSLRSPTVGAGGTVPWG